MLLQRINISIDLTANHKGYFVIKMCPNNNLYRDPEQTCFDKYPLRVSGTKSSKFHLTNGRTYSGTYNYFVELPKGVTCKHCVLQWTYYTANNWGICPDGSSGGHCGDPEVFRNCADIKIEIDHTSNSVFTNNEKFRIGAKLSQKSEVLVR